MSRTSIEFSDFSKFRESGTVVASLSFTHEWQSLGAFNDKYFVTDFPEFSENI